jgi:hypothetical protein
MRIENFFKELTKFFKIIFTGECNKGVFNADRIIIGGEKGRRLKNPS